MHVKVRKIENCGNLVGSVTIACDSELGELTLYNLSVINGSKGYFLSPPSRKGKDGKYYCDYYLTEADEILPQILKELGLSGGKKKWSKNNG